jgi:DNA invertase Pin-like site-specific DNA recombinase
LKRPVFDRLQKAIFTGTVTTVVVWKLDRISRGQRDGVNLLADWCERVVAVTQQIDLSGTVGRMVASVLFGLAEIESEGATSWPSTPPRPASPSPMAVGESRAVS